MACSFVDTRIDETQKLFIKNPEFCEDVHSKGANLDDGFG